MTNIILPGDMTQPRVVTFNDLLRTLTPVLASWGMTQREVVLELHDLWSMGAPAPTNGPDTPADLEKRVLIHTQFNKWWHEAMAKRGMTVTPQQVWHA